MKASQADFAGRMFLLEESKENLEIWCHAFLPMTPNRRSLEEWVKEHIDSMHLSELAEMLECPAEGNFQVLFRGTLSGYPCGPYDEEWDEAIEFFDVEFVPIPDEYFKEYLTPKAPDEEDL